MFEIEQFNQLNINCSKRIVVIKVRLVKNKSSILAFENLRMLILLQKNAILNINKYIYFLMTIGNVNSIFHWFCKQTT